VPDKTLGMVKQPGTDTQPGRGLELGLVLVLSVVLLLSACSGTPGADRPGIGSTPEAGFVGGDGTITIIEPAKRVAAPALAGTTVDEQQYEMADDKGKVVVINVWGSWCPPCRKEAPQLVQAHERLTAGTKEPAVAFVGIDTRDPSRAAAKAYQRKFDVPYPSVYDPSGTLLLGFADSLPPSAIPSTLVIDEEGRVAARVLGGITAATLEDLVHQVRDG
jgi:thiol-disulfide isomerase/thioredoxin